MFDTTAIWERRGNHTIPRSVFNVFYCLFTLAGMGMTFAAAQFTWGAIWGGWETFGYCIATLVACIIGSSLITESQFALLSFVGYALIAIPMGLLYGSFFGAYDSALIFEAIGVTMGFVIILGLIGALYPKSLQHWGMWLVLGLFAAIGGYIVFPILGWLGLPIGNAFWSFYEFILILFFGGFVVYDANRAQRVPSTFNNCIDCAASLYLTWLNILIRYVFLRGQK